MKSYTILIHPQALKKARAYLRSLQTELSPGRYLGSILEKISLSEASIWQFLEALLQTKKPQIFAETSVSGNGSDWNQAELAILGDISIAVPVQAYDNGLHRYPKPHKHPFQATLLFTPGALLRNGRGNPPADWDEVVTNNVIDPEGFYQLYERRLLPVLRYASDLAAARGRRAFITVPGLGCGQFAGEFHGQIGSYLQTAIYRITETHKDSLQGIKAIYFDPYQECENKRHELGHISFIVRPLTKGNLDKPQLCTPTHYEEAGDDFSDCDLFSVVAWDHVSWPGNDFFAGLRATDDGVKAAATDSMKALTGIEGKYDESTCEYTPPGDYQSWEGVVKRNDLQLQITDNFKVLPEQ